jgi:hypothetical protein
MKKRLLLVLVRLFLLLLMMTSFIAGDFAQKIDYVSFGPDSGHFFIREKDGLLAYFSKSGKQISEFKYRSVRPPYECAGPGKTVRNDPGVWPFFNGYAIVLGAGGKYGVMDQKGIEIIACELVYDKIGYLVEYFDTFCFFYQNGRYGMMDKSGKTVVPAVYDKAVLALERLCELKPIK